MPLTETTNKKAAAAAKSGKVGDEPSNVHRQEDEVKPLPKEEAPAPDTEEEDDAAEEDWDYKGPVPAGEIKICQGNDCGKPAVRIWVGAASGTEWAGCLSCEKEEYGSDVEEEVEAATAAASATIKGDNDITQVTKTEPEGDAATKPQEDESAIVSATPSIKKQDNTSFLTPPPGGEPKDQQDPTDAGDDEDEEGDAFDLIDFFRFDKLKNSPRVCDICGDKKEGANIDDQIHACTIWQGSETKSKYNYCIDCQQNDFDGFPDKEELLRHNALKHLDSATIHEHIKLMKQNCSRMRNPPIPNLASYLSSSASGGGAGRALSLKTNTNFVTPSPKTLASSYASTQDEDDGMSLVSTILPKWRKEAEAFQGKDANLVLKKPEAQKLIYDTLKNQWAPMTITEIHKVRED